MVFFQRCALRRQASMGERCAIQGEAKGPERGGGAFGSYGRRRGRAQSTEQRAKGSEARAKIVALFSLCQPRLRSQPRATMDTLPEWSKGVDSSSTSASCVGSNPTGVNVWPRPGIHIMRYCRCVHNIVSLTFSCLPAACFFTSFMFVCCSAINGSPQCFMCVCRSCLCMSLLCLCELGMFHTYELLCAC